MKQPNILLITVDQMRFDHLGLKGVGGIRTPHLDRLGREGIHFDRAYTSSPVCTPARLTLLTGQYPSVHGGYSIGVSVDPFPSRTLPGILSAHGYGTALIGKSHFVARPHEAQHFAGRPNPPSSFFRDHTGPYAGFEYVQLSTHHTTNGRPECHYGAWLEEQGVDYADWFPDVNGRHDHAQTGVWTIPVALHDTTWTADRTLDYLARAPGRPWFCWCSFNDPHEPFVCPEPWYSAVETDAMQLLEPYRDGEFADKPPFYRSVYETDRWPGAFVHTDGYPVPCAFARHDLRGREREAMQATLGMVAMLDHQVGRLLEGLERSGQADNTLVIFTTDHGELHNHHGLWHKGLFAYEDCQRIPFLAWGPGLVRAQGTRQALVNLVDLPRTFLDLAGIDIPQGMQGVSLAPLFDGSRDRVQDSTVVELQATRRIHQQTLITDRYKLVLYRDQEWGELYDLYDDPDQYVNLWDRAEALPVRLRLLQEAVRADMRREGHVHDRVAFG